MVSTPGLKLAPSLIRTSRGSWLSEVAGVMIFLLWLGLSLVTCGERLLKPFLLRLQYMKNIKIFFHIFEFLRMCSIFFLIVTSEIPQVLDIFFCEIDFPNLIEARYKDDAAIPIGDIPCLIIMFSSIDSA